MNHQLKYFFGLVTALFLLASCTKQIDQSPTNTVNGTERFKTIGDYEFALTGAYSELLRNSYYGTTDASGQGANGFVSLPDMMSDNLYESGESLVNYTEFARWYYTADDTYIQDIWLDAYSVARQANIVLRGIDNLSSENAGAVNRIKAQALALRALAHFDLLRFFGEDFGRNSTKLGVPYIESFDTEEKPSRLTVKETFDKIEADLHTAKALMQNMDADIESTTSTSGSARSLVDEMVVNAMLARMYNYAGVSDSALKYATLVIDERPLATADEYPKIWTDASTADVVWSVKFQPFNSDIGGSVYYAPGDRASYYPSDDLLNSYNQTDDVRFGSFFGEISSRLVVSKYLGKEGRTPDGIVDFKAFRVSEMYLIRAEAYNRLGQNALSLADLNAVREARGAATGSGSGAALLTAIFNERRKELFMEGHRFFDLKRTTRTITRTETNGDVSTLASDAREWAFPIPQSEIQANPNMAQNPGY